MKSNNQKTKKFKTKKLFKIAVILIIIVFVVLIIVGFLAPNIVKNQLEKNGKEWVGRRLKIEDVSVNYFTSTINLVGAKMFEANDKDTFVSLDSLKLDLDMLKYFSSEVVVEELNVKNLWVNISQKDSVFNFDDLITFYNTSDSTLVAEDKAEPLLFNLSNLKLNGGTLVYNDKILNVTQTIENLSFFLPHIEWGRGASNMDASFKLNNGGSFGVNSNFNSKNGDYKFHVNIDSLDIAQFKPYTEAYLVVSQVKGTASGEIDITGNINNLNNLSIRGNTNVSNFALLDSVGKTFLGAKKLICPIEEMLPMKYVYNFGNITLTEPNVSFDLYEDSNNFYKSFGLDTPEQVADSSLVTQETEPIVYSVNSIHLDGGTFHFTDYTTERRPFTYEFSEMKMDIDPINKQSEWVSGKASMILNKRGQLAANIGFNPNDAGMNMKVDYVISDFQLSDLNIYSMQYTGYPILYGDMYYKGNMDIDAGKLNLENKLIVHNAEIGNKRKSAFYKLPLKVALYILKDKDGVINMDVPVKGDLNDPKINLRKIIWKTLGNFLLKTATSPFRALSNLINVDPSDIKEINYTYLDTTLTTGKEHQLKLLRKLETSKPNLDIELVYFNDKRRQKEEILKQLQVDSLQVDSISNYFDNKRLKDIETFLNRNYADSTRIKVTAPEKFNPKNRGSQPVFEIKYKIQGVTNEN
ncbi:DUF748 domain-containing protein [Neotamlana laminarinivorans]|uniref:DUF748 domain-containing protein n=1 Tax=Neotamlana laminarinivorans TaxID=2883124 RepID=A0A9X1HXI0_9FLAO|nr:DUF748 domain-containing protein [Tamlana laminarinivorans]MCB4797710.1 DUF748 domain-containing protein [Tamlana laminarinivorans]